MNQDAGGRPVTRVNLNYVNITTRSLTTRKNRYHELNDTINVCIVQFWLATPKSIRTETNKTVLFEYHTAQP